VIWRFRGDGWESIDLSPLSWPDWWVSAVRASSQGDIWATGFIDLPGDQGHPPAPRRFRPILLRSDGSAWKVDESPRQDGRRWSFSDICFHEEDTGWFVGADFSADDAHRALARWRGLRARGAHPAGIRNTWMDWSFSAQRSGCPAFFLSETATRVSSESQAIPSTLP
jgi:hypothetical protein